MNEWLCEILEVLQKEGRSFCAFLLGPSEPKKAFVMAGHLWECSKQLNQFMAASWWCLDDAVAQLLHYFTLQLVSVEFNELFKTIALLLKYH